MKLKGFARLHQGELCRVVSLYQDVPHIEFFETRSDALRNVQQDAGYEIRAATLTIEEPKPKKGKRK